MPYLFDRNARAFLHASGSMEEDCLLVIIKICGKLTQLELLEPFLESFE
jgi:hypothetical protein